MKTKFIVMLIIFCFIITFTGCTGSTAVPESAPTSVPPTAALVAATEPTSSDEIAATETAVSPTAAASSTTKATTPEPMPLVAAPQVLVYSGGQIARTNVTGSGIAPIAPPLGRVGDDVWRAFWANPVQISPDGRYLLTSASVNENVGNWQVVEVDSGALVAAGQGQSQLSPTWSPDSIQLAYLRDGQICLYELTAQTESCTEIGLNLLGASWSPAGTHIAIAQADLTAADFSGTVLLFDIATQTTEPIGRYQAPPEAAVSDVFSWSADGTHLLIKTSDERPSLLYDVAAGTATQLPQSARDLAPNGQMVLYQSGAVGLVDGDIVYSLPTNESCPQPRLGLHNWAWSPDNTRLAYLLSCAEVPTTTWLYVLDTASGKTQWQQELTKLGNTFPLEFVYWSADGTVLLLDEPDELFDGHRQLSPIWRIAADGRSAPEELIKQGFLLDLMPTWANE